jgi:hypothetical protein
MYNLGANLTPGVTFLALGAILKTGFSWVRFIIRWEKVSWLGRYVLRKAFCLVF